MKIRTNLSPGELEVVAKGLLKSAEKQAHPHYKPENAAEQYLNDEADAIFSKFCESLTSEISRILSS